MPPKKIVTDDDKIQSKVTCIGKKFNCDYTDVNTCVSDAQKVPATYRVPDFRFFLNQRCGIPEDTAESMIKNGKKKDMCEALVSYNTGKNPRRISSSSSPAQPPQLPIKTSASVVSSRPPPSVASSKKPPSVASESIIKPSSRPPSVASESIIKPSSRPPSVISDSSNRPPPLPMPQIVPPTATLTDREIRKQNLLRMQLELEEEERLEEEKRLADIRLEEEKRLADIRLAEASDDFNKKINEIEQIIKTINVDDTTINNKLKVKFKDIFNYLRNKKKKNPSLQFISQLGSVQPSVPIGSPRLSPLGSVQPSVPIGSPRLSPLGSVQPPVLSGSPPKAEPAPISPTSLKEAAVHEDDDNWVEMLTTTGLPSLQVGSTTKIDRGAASARGSESPRSPFSSPEGVNPLASLTATMPMEASPPKAESPAKEAAELLSPPRSPPRSPPLAAASPRSPTVVYPSKFEKSPSIKNIENIENIEELVPDLRKEEDGSEIIEEIIKCLSI